MPKIIRNGIAYGKGGKIIVHNGVAYGGSHVAKLVEKTITANGIYTATSDGADGYSAVTVAVPSPTAYAGIAIAKTAADAQHLQYKAFAKADYSRLTAAPIMCKEANDIFPFTTFSLSQDEETATITYCDTTVNVAPSNSNTRVQIPNVDYFTLDGSLDFTHEYAISSRGCLLSFEYEDVPSHVGLVFGKTVSDIEYMAMRALYVPSGSSSSILYKSTFGATMTGNMAEEPIENLGSYTALVPLVSTDGTKHSDGIYKVIYNIGLHGFYEIAGELFFISGGLAIKDE